MNIRHTPLVHADSYITVMCADNKERIIKWYSWGIPKKELLEIEESIKNGTCMNQLCIGSTKMFRLRHEPHIVDMFATIARALGDHCFEDEQFAEKVLAAASRTAKEYDANNPCANSKELLKKEKASIRYYKQRGDKSKLAYKYAKIIHYFRLFNITKIDLWTYDEGARDITYKITTPNGGRINLTVDYGGLTENQMKEIDECLCLGKNAVSVSEELYNTALGIYDRFITHGFIYNHCCEEREYPYVNNFNIRFTQELVAESVKINRCPVELAEEILKTAEKTENLRCEDSDGKIYDLLSEFFYNYHPYEIERVEEKTH